MASKFNVEDFLKGYKPEEGLMGKICELLKPPSFAPVKVAKRKHEYYKKRGKEHNRDCCDSCKEQGDLICCDHCPASFHLECCDPPLEEDDLPDGEWRCHMCSVLTKKDKKGGNVVGGLLPNGIVATFPSTKSTNDDSSGGSGSISPLDSAWKSRPSKARPSHKSKKKAHPKSLDSGNSILTEARGVSPVVDSSLGKAVPLYEEALELLISCCKTTNPEEFQLPSDYCTNEPLPGTSWYNQRRKRVSHEQLPTTSIKRPYTHVETGIIPLPAKLCYTCGRSCSQAALIECDFCQCAFHLNCLNPPLTSFPQGRWMCPNHPDHILPNETKNKSWTRRCAVYNFFRQPFDEERVKLDFLRKAKRKWPPWNSDKTLVSNTHGPMYCTKVPSAIKHMYSQPMALTSSMSSAGFSEQPSDFSHSTEKISEDQTLWLSSLLDLQLFLAKSEAQKLLSETSLASEKGWRRETDNESVDLAINSSSHQPPLSVQSGQPPLPLQPDQPPLLQPDQSLSLQPDQSLSLQPDPPPTSLPPGKTLSVNGIFAEEAQKSHLNDSLHLSSDNNNLDTSVDLKRLAEIAAKSIDRTTIPLHLGSPQMHQFYHTFLQLGNIEKHSQLGEVLSRLDESLVKMLAAQRLQQLVLENGNLTSNLSTASCALYLVGRLAPPIVLHKSKPLTLGIGNSADVNLNTFSCCKFISDVHASVYYDEISEEYELLPYSEHGVIVDNVVYCVDESSVLQLPTTSLASKTTSSTHLTAPNEDCNYPQSQTGCQCQVSPLQRSDECSREVLPRWEGSAALNHGSVIQIGCISFAFAITSNATSDPLEH